MAHNMNDNNERNNTQLNIPHSKNKSKDTKPLIQNINSNNLVIQETQKQKKNILNNGSIAGNFINKYILKKNRLSNEQEEDIQDTIDKHFFKSSIDLLGYKGLTHDPNHYLILSNEYNETVGFAEMIKVEGQALADLPNEAMKSVVSDFIVFLRQYLDDIEFISLPLPNDSHKQQNEWTLKLNEVENLLANNSDKLSEREREQLLAQRKYIKETIAIFKSIDINLLNQGYVLIVYENTIPLLKNAVNNIFRLSSNTLRLHKMTVKDKETLCHRINNPLTVGHNN